MLEKYLNLEGFLVKSLKNKYVLKRTVKTCKGIEKSLNSFIFCKNYGNTVVRDLNQNKTFVPLFGAANTAPNKGTTLLQ